MTTKTTVCPKGHDKDKMGRTSQGRCLECHRERDRERRRANGAKPRIPGMCYAGIHPKPGPGLCRECRLAKQRAYRAKVKSGEHTPPRSLKFRAQPEDGFEAEFGPVPERVPDREWYDREIVRRALVGYPTGRVPYPLEQEDIVRRRTHEGNEQIAYWCGVEPKTVWEWTVRYNG